MVALTEGQELTRTENKGDSRMLVMFLDLSAGYMSVQSVEIHCASLYIIYKNVLIKKLDLVAISSLHQTEKYMERVT